MAAGNYDITIEQGADFDRICTWKTDAGVVVNITGYTARMMIKTHPDETSILSLTSAAGGGITLGGIAGTVTINIPAATTALFSFTKARYDLELVEPSGKVIRFLQGNVTLSKEITE